MPLCICALGVTLAFKRCGFGTSAARAADYGRRVRQLFALFCTGWNHWALLAAMFLAAPWAAGCEACRRCSNRWNTSETLFTLMLNYIALYLVSYLQAMAGPGGRGGKRL